MSNDSNLKNVDNNLGEQFKNSDSNLFNPATDLIVGSHELSAAQQKFLELHEEMHRQFDRLHRPARVAPDMVINPILMDTSGSMMPEDNSGSMASVIGGTDFSGIINSLIANPPKSKQKPMVIVFTDGDGNTQKFPKPKYEKFKSNEAMIEEKLLTGRNRRSNKDVAEVRYESRRLNKKLKMRLKKAKLVQTFKF